MQEETDTMKNGQVPVALASAYLLGRSHKMRWALPLAGIAAGSRLRPGGGGIGANLLKSPEINKLTQTLRDELLSAGKTAAVAAVGSRIDSLSDRMQRRASSLRAGPEAEEPPDEEEEPRGEEEEEPGEEEEPRGEEEEKEEPAEKAKQREKGRSAQTRAPSGGRTRTRATRPAADKKKTRGSNSKSTSRKTASSRRTVSSGSSGSGGSAQRGRG
jgi:outer membrane biosynthesis protein TonB